MPKLHARLATGLVAASALALGVLATPAFAQADAADKIRGQCIEEVMKAYPNPSTDLQVSRVNLYIACIKRNGLQP